MRKYIHLNVTKNEKTLCHYEVDLIYFSVLVILVTAAGNILVCLAIARERKLQNTTNYFLMSLAIADCLVALLVMPMGMIAEVLGRFLNNYSKCQQKTSTCYLYFLQALFHSQTMFVLYSLQ